METFVQNAGASLLSQQLPGLGTSLANVVNPASLLGTAVSNLTINAPTTIDQLVSQLSALLGQPVTVSFTNNVLQINLNYSFSTTQNANLGFNLSPTPGQHRRRQRLGAAEPDGQRLGHAGLDIDLSQPSSPQFYLQDSSKISVGALVNASGVAFNATVGPLGLSISGGTVRLDNGTQGQPATWTVGLNPSSANHLWPLVERGRRDHQHHQGAGPHRPADVLPHPRPAARPDHAQHRAARDRPGQPGSTTTVIVPNFASALSSVSLNGIMDQVSTAGTASCGCCSRP